LGEWAIPVLALPIFKVVTLALIGAEVQPVEKEGDEELDFIQMRSKAFNWRRSTISQWATKSMGVDTGFFCGQNLAFLY